MPLQLLDADYGDGDAISFVYTSSFIDDRCNMMQFPGVGFDQFLTGAVSRWPRNYGDISNIYKKVVDTDTGEVISFSKWQFSNTTAATIQRKTGLPDNFVAERPTTPEGLNDEFATEFSDKIVKIRERVLAHRPSLRLLLMGTIPTHQRRGAGSLHLAWAAEIADREGLVCWTEASPMGLSLYQKFDYVVQDEVVSVLDESIGGGTYTYSSVLREAKSERNLERDE